MAWNLDRYRAILLNRISWDHHRHRQNPNNPDNLRRLTQLSWGRYSITDLKTTPRLVWSGDDKLLLAAIRFFLHVFRTYRESIPYPPFGEGPHPIPPLYYKSVPGIDNLGYLDSLPTRLYTPLRPCPPSPSSPNTSRRAQSRFWQVNRRKADEYSVQFSSCASVHIAVKRARRAALLDSPSSSSSASSSPSSSSSSSSSSFSFSPSLPTSSSPSS